MSPFAGLSSVRAARCRLLSIAAALLLVGAGCGGADTAEEGAGTEATEAGETPMTGGETLSAEDQAAIDQVKTTTQAYRDLQAAMAAGYSEQTPPGCMTAPDGSGAQGIHYLNTSLVDATVDVQTPELLMYEPQADGSMTLVGIDYMIPFDQWTAADPPTLLGRPLMRNEELGVWAIHIWTERENPNGLFAAWNPNVSCEHAH